MSKNIERIIKELSNLPSTSGDEEAVVDYLKKELKGTELTIERDNLGSIAFIKKGTGKGPKIMFAAHMDSPGFMVSSIDKQGTIRLTQMGGWWGHVLLSQLVEIHTNKEVLTGIIGSKPPHIVTPQERTRVVELKDMFVDIGSTSKEETINKFGVKIGDRVTPKTNAFNLNGTHYIAGKGLDDRASLAAGLIAIKELSKVETEGDIYFVGTTQEEVGLRGAKTAAQKWNCDVSIGMDVTISYDSPGLPDKPVALDKGASFTIMDRGNIANKKLFSYMEEVANTNKIPYEKDMFVSGGTDTAELQRAHDGSIAMTISIPLRYMHSHYEVISTKDVESVSKLLVEATKKLTAKEYSKLVF